MIRGGKGPDRIIYLDYIDDATTGDDRYRIARLKWPLADSKPTLLSVDVWSTIEAVIQAANPQMNVLYVPRTTRSVFEDRTLAGNNFIGTSDYGSIFVRFVDGNTDEDHIAEIGAGSVSTSGPIWGNNVWGAYAWYVGPGGAYMNGGMSPSESSTITGLGIGGSGYFDIYGNPVSIPVRAAVYTGGSLSDPTGATLLWDAGIINMEPGDFASRWEVAHPVGGVTLPADTPTWIATKFYWGPEVPVYRNTNLYVNMASTPDALPVDDIICGDFQNGRGSYNLCDWKGGDGPFLIDDDVYVSFPGSIPAGGEWDGDGGPPTAYGWPIAYVTLAETSSYSSSSSNSAASAPDIFASEWSFLRLMSSYDYTSKELIRQIEVCEDRAYILADDAEFIESPFLSDTFAGTNGNPPDITKWEVLSGSPTIQSNALELTQVGSSGTEEQIRMTHTILDSYMDISVDFELINYAAVEDWGIDLVMYSDVGVVYEGQERFSKYAHVRYGYWGGEYGYQCWTSSSGTTDKMIGVIPHTTGKLRILVNPSSRISGAYYWDNGAWVKIGSLGGPIMRLALSVYNNTPAQNITWRASNLAISLLWETSQIWNLKFYVYNKNSFAVSDISDDFTGSNGDPLSSKWTDESEGTGSVEIQGNRARITCGSGAGNTGMAELATEIVGDFDAQIDIDAFVSPNVNTWQGALRFYIDSTHYFMVELWRSYNSWYWAATACNGGSSYSVESDYRQSDSGALRITRNGSNLIGYYDQDRTGSWTSLLGYGDNGELIGNESGVIQLMVNCWSNYPSATVDFDNFIIDVGSRQFTDLITSKSVDQWWSDGFSAGSAGAAIIVEKIGWYLYDQPWVTYWDLIIYDENLDKVNQTNYGVEYIMGEQCGWKRDIYDWGDFIDSLDMERGIAGSYPNHLFLEGTSYFINGENNWVIIEVDPTTLNLTRASVLHTSSALFNGTEIQDAIIIP